MREGAPTREGDALGVFALVASLSPLFLLPLSLVGLLFGSLILVSLLATALALLSLPAGFITGLIAFFRAQRRGSSSSVASLAMSISVVWLVLLIAAGVWFVTVGGKGLISSLAH